MSVNVILSFPESPSAAAVVADGFVVHRYELREAMSELFELVLEVRSTDPAIAESSIVGQPIVVAFGDEPFVTEMRGIVRQTEQRTSVPDGESRYVWTVVPPLWLATRRQDCRIFQHLSTPEIVDAVLADATYGGRIPAPAKRLGDHAQHEYVVQYAESDWAFLSRILADEGIASLFDHANGSTWTLVDDTAADALRVAGAIPFSPASFMNPILGSDPNAPHVQTAAVISSVETSVVTLRDYDFQKPRFTLEAKKATDGDTFKNEAPLEAYSYAVGKFETQAPGDARAVHQLDAARADRRRVVCTASFWLSPGTCLPLTDHPRDDLNSDFLVVRAHTVREGDSLRTYELELVDLETRFRPAHRPKARIHGTQTAFVVTANGDEIDVDKYGRVLVEFRWDRRDQHTGACSRRVRVSQGWAGDGYGLVTLPRRGDEVVIAYLDGDPEQPLVVGRVHNAVFATPLNLPDERAISVWRSRSTPGGGGYNQILMDDKASAERLELHAQRDFKHVTERDAETVVGRNESRTVKGNRSLHVVGNQSEKVEGNKDIDATGALDLHGKTVTVMADTTMELYSGAHMQLSCASDRDDFTSSNHAIDAESLFLKGRSAVQVVAPKVHVFGGNEIHLQVGGSSIHIEAGGIKIVGAGFVEVNGPVVKLNC